MKKKSYIKDCIIRDFNFLAIVLSIHSLNRESVLLILSDMEGTVFTCIKHYDYYFLCFQYKRI